MYGLHLVKLAVLLTVITGSNNIIEEGDTSISSDDKHATRIRGQCHLLLVGDPGLFVFFIENYLKLLFFGR